MALHCLRFLMQSMFHKILIWQHILWKKNRFCDQKVYYNWHIMSFAKNLENSCRNQTNYNFTNSVFPKSVWPHKSVFTWSLLTRRKTHFGKCLSLKALPYLISSQTKIFWICVPLKFPALTSCLSQFVQLKLFYNTCVNILCRKK